LSLPIPDGEKPSTVSALITTSLANAGTANAKRNARTKMILFISKGFCLREKFGKKEEVDMPTSGNTPTVGLTGRTSPRRTGRSRNILDGGKIYPPLWSRGKTRAHKSLPAQTSN